jgi:hypothetical protein
MVNFVNTYVRNAKANPQNKGKSEDALALEGYKVFFVEGPRLPGEAIAAQKAIAGGAQGLTAAGQIQASQTVPIKEWNDLKVTDPAKRAYNKAVKEDDANAKLGTPSNKAGAIRDTWIQSNTPSGTPRAIITPPGAPGAAPPAAPAAAVPSKVMTQADVAATAKARGISTAEVAAAARLAGYTIR